MSGELTLSQFKSTVTQNNDFVIGNPVPALSTDIADRYLVFQVTDKIGPTHNPHVRCEYSGGSWRIKLSDNGVTDSDFAFLNTNQTFIATNTFSGTTHFTGPFTTKGGTLGENDTDIITFAGSPNFVGPLVFSNLVTFTNDVVVNAPTHSVTISAANVKSNTKTIVVNNQVPTSYINGGMGLEVNNVGSVAGYIKTTVDNTGWELKTPNKSGTVVIIPSTENSSMTFKPSGGSFGIGNSYVFEFLPSSGRVGTYPAVPAGGKVVVSTTTGFLESSTPAAKLAFLNNVTSDINTLFGSYTSALVTLSGRTDTAEANATIALVAAAGATAAVASLTVDLNAALYGASGLTAMAANAHNELMAYVGPTGALSTSITDLHTVVYDPTTGLTATAANAHNELLSYAGPTGALATLITGLSAAVYDPSTGMTATRALSNSAMSAAAGATAAVATLTSDLNAALYGASGLTAIAANAHTELIAYVGPTGSLGLAVTNLQSSMSGATADISSLMSTMNGVTGTWAIDANSQGHIAGVKLINGPTGSSFSILTNKFQLLDNGTTPGLTGPPKAPFTYNNGVITLDSTVVFTSPGLATGAFLTGWQNDLAALATGTTIIDGGRITTHSIASDQLATTLALANVIQSPNYASPIPGSGAGLTAPAGFKLSGATFPTRFIGDLSNTDVQFELGTNANFGGYKVGSVTDKVFAAPAVAYYNAIAITTQYPLSTTNPTPLVEQLRSGISVTQSSPGDFTATEDGIYTVSLAIQNHGSNTDGSYVNAYMAIKRAATSGSGYTEVVYHDWNFFAGGRSEAHVSGQIAMELLAGDSLGVFYTAPGMSYANIWLTMVRLGLRAPSDAINITVPATVSRNSIGATAQTQYIPLTVSNAFGLATWSLDSGGLNGASTPAASITGAAGNTLAIVYATAAGATGDYGVAKTINLRATDSSSVPKFDTQSVSYTLNAPSAITITNLSSAYFAVIDWLTETTDVPLTATGGSGVYTWTITARTGDLTASTIVTHYGGLAYVNCGLTAAGAGTVTVECNDSAGGTPDTMVITINAVDYGGGGGGGWDPGVCFAPGTFVLMSDGTSKTIESIVTGDSVYAINALSHQSGLKEVIPTKILRTGVNTQVSKMVSVKGILATDNHPWGVESTEGANLWVASRLLNTSLVHRSVTVSSKNKTSVVDVQAQDSLFAGTCELVHSLSTTDRSYFVGATKNGPWFLVHNMCPIDLVMPT